MLVIQEALGDQSAGSANLNPFRIQHYMTNCRFIYFYPALN